MTRRLIEDDFTAVEAVIGEKVVWVVPYKDIYEAPTVDAEPVIRCEECKYFCAEQNEYDTPYGFTNTYWTCWCDKHTDYANQKYLEVNTDDFCSWGEKKEETDAEEQTPSDACDQISELVMKRLKADRILEQLGQILGEVFSEISEVVDSCNEFLKEKRKQG